jgi:HEAT repeat protein
VQSFWHFTDVLKYPKLWLAMAKRRRAVDRASEEAEAWSDAELAASVERFIFEVESSEDAWAEERILRGLGSRVHPVLLQVLADASLRTKLVTPTGEILGGIPEAPVNRVCKLLGDSPPVEAIGLVTPFLNEPSEQIRKDVALVLGSIGTPEIASPLRKAMADSDEYVRDYALIGLKRAIKSQRLNDECSHMLHGDIQKLLVEGKNAGAAAGLLLHFNQERAVELFLSDAIFTPNHKSLHEALNALAEAKVAVPRERLLAIIAQLEAGDLKYPCNYALREALRLLGQRKSSEDQTLLRARMQHKDRKVAEGASAGLLASHSLENFRQRLWNIEGQPGLDLLTAPQRHCRAILILDAEVNNGGLSQYFVNSSGDHWRDALAGLNALGSKERASVLYEAVAKFGGTGPSEDRTARLSQLAKLVQDDEDVFETLEQRYYESTEVVEVMMTCYVLDHVDAFQ